jgi:mono/diheme cytochrome c family protein
MPGHAKSGEEELRPQDQLNFRQLYGKNCAACHGTNGQNGPAIDLANPTYQAIVDDATMKKWITSGMPGTQMPAFGESAGGMLTDHQVDALVAGMRKNWAKPGTLDGQNAPPYAANLQGDAKRGEQVYKAYCISNHLSDKQLLTDPAYLALVSDQALRTLIIAGRPDLGHPDWRGDLSKNPAGHPMTNQDVTDIVTYLGSLRIATPGQPYPEHQR